MRAPAGPVFAFVFALLVAGPIRSATALGPVEIGGAEICYRAQPGTIELPDDRGRARGSVFYVAYERTGLAADESKRRPVAFLFNGGPGSSSAWLHLGAFGPRRLALGDGGLAKPAGPFGTVANEHSLLDVADLVFIDPIGTGFSRAADAIAARQFYSFRGDVASVADFIGRYLDKAGRRASPCVLIGESYGAMRACGLAPELEEKHGIVVSGLVLVSGPIVMGRNSPPDQLLPTAAATAHYHGLLAPDLQALDREELLVRVGDFVAKEYRSALGGGDLDAGDRERVAEQVRRFTGLGRLSGISFSLREVRALAMRELGIESIGIYDTRVTSNRRVGRFRGGDRDPAMTIISDPMEAVMENYLRADLGYETDLSYRLLHRIPLWSHSGSKAASTLARALKTNRGLQVFVASGYYDNVTPMGVVRYAVEEADVALGQRKNIHYHSYEGGHMMYTNLAALELLSRDVRAFIRESSKRERGPALVPVSALQSQSL